MPEDQNPIPELPEEEIKPSWLAQNRKLAILIGVVAVLVGAVALTVWWPASREAIKNNSNNIATDNTNSATTNKNSRPTFQRSTAVNAAPVTLPSYQPPSLQDLKSAINQLNTNN